MVKKNSIRAWFLASRPKTLTGAMIPVILGGSLAHYHVHHLNLWLLAGCALFASFMQVAANFINDLYDYQKGSDREDRLGPQRACAQGWITPSAMKRGIAIVIAIAAATGLCVVAFSWRTLPFHGLEYIALGATCIASAYLYTTCLSYLGWGDVLVLIFFGFVPVCGTYYLQTLCITPQVLILSLVSGIAIDALLIINNYRDRDQDRLSGKRTIVVRFGEPFGRYLYLAIGLSVWLLLLLLAIRPSYLVPAATVYLLLHIATWRRMSAIRHGRELNTILGETSRNMFIMSLLVALALCLP